MQAQIFGNKCSLLEVKFQVRNEFCSYEGEGQSYIAKLSPGGEKVWLPETKGKGKELCFGLYH